MSIKAITLKQIKYQSKVVGQLGLAEFAKPLRQHFQFPRLEGLYKYTRKAIDVFLAPCANHHKNNLFRKWPSQDSISVKRQQAVKKLNNAIGCVHFL